MALTKIPSELSSTTGIVDNSNATAITIDSNENVGIGTSSPISKMQVSGANNGDVFYLTSSDVEDDRGLMFSNSTNGIIWDLDAKGASSLFGQMTFSTNGTERMRIDASGNLLVGTTSAVSGNEVCIQGRGTGSSFLTLSPNASYSQAIVSNGDNLVFFGRGTAGSISTVGSITCTSSSTSYNTSSDYRLKENVVELTGATERLKQLNPSRFNFIADADTTVDGFLAHEVADVVPEAISGEKDAMKDEEYEVTPAVLDEEGNVVTEAVIGTRSVPEYQGIDQSKLVPLLVATIQELEARITELENN